MTRRAVAITTTAFLAGAVAPAGGAEVSFSISSYETYVGVPIKVEVRVENARTHDPPDFPEIDGADVQVGGTNQMTSRTLTSRGWASQTTYVYTYLVVPRRAGTLIIPPIRVSADGESSETQRARIVVRKSDAGDLLFVELVGERESVYVGEPIEVTLEIWLKSFASSRYPLDYNDMWRCIDQKNSSWGPFLEVVADTRNVKVRQAKRRDDDGLMQTYHIYSLQRKVWPERPGVFDAGGVNIVVNYPLQVRRNRFSLLGSKYVVTESRPISAAVSDSDIVIKSLPTERQPESFTGAVGRYTISVSARPLEVSVGDPITINMVIRGNGLMDVLQAPPLAGQESLTADFRVPDEPLAGVIQRGSKTFSQSIRAKRDDITEIPPVEFTYFDPKAERYVTIESDPIPLTIKQSTRMPVSQVVENRETSGTRTSLTLVEEGLLANYNDIDSLLTNQSATPGWGAVGMAVGWPLVYASCLLIRRRSERLRTDTGLARRRSARKNAMAMIHRASRQSDSAAVASDIAAAVTGYVADRCNLPPGGVTRADATGELLSRGVSEELVSRVDALLAECESAQYAGARQTGASDTVSLARQCVDELEHRKF